MHIDETNVKSLRKMVPKSCNIRSGRVQEARFLRLWAPEVSIQPWSCQYPAMKMIQDIEKVEIGARSLEAGTSGTRKWLRGWRATARLP